MTPQLQFLQMLAQRAGNTPAGQAITGLAQRGAQSAADLGRRGMEAAGRLESRFPPLPRGPSGQFPARSAAERVPLQQISRGAAGAAGVGSVATGGAGSFGTISNPFASPAPSNMQDVFGQLDRQTRGLGPSAPPTEGMSVMDSIMAGRQGDMMYDRSGLPDDALGGFPSAPPANASGFMPPANIPMPVARPSLPGRTPGFLDQLLSGTDYQSNSMPVDIRAQGPSMPGQQMPLQSINYGDPESAADFFRADRLAMQNPGVPGFLGGF